jgi:hypothetical protein
MDQPMRRQKSCRSCNGNVVLQGVPVQNFVRQEVPVKPLQRADGSRTVMRLRRLPYGKRTEGRAIFSVSARITRVVHRRLV